MQLRSGDAAPNGSARAGGCSGSESLESARKSAKPDVDDFLPPVSGQRWRNGAARDSSSSLPKDPFPYFMAPYKLRAVYQFLPRSQDIAGPTRRLPPNKGSGERPPRAHICFSGRYSTADHINLRVLLFLFFGVFRTGTGRGCLRFQIALPDRQLVAGDGVEEQDHALAVGKLFKEDRVEPREGPFADLDSSGRGRGRPSSARA